VSQTLPPSKAQDLRCIAYDAHQTGGTTLLVFVAKKIMVCIVACTQFFSIDDDNNHDDGCDNESESDEGHHLSVLATCSTAATA
jgi:hypothetical protein